MRPVVGGHVIRARGIALAAVIWGLVATCVVAADEGGDPAVDPAIPPGEEEIIAGMLGRGAAVQHCTLVRGGVDYTVIDAVYDCPGGEVSVQLAHPWKATATSIQTGQFAITVQGGSPPRGFEEALARLVHAREDDFQWGWQESDAPPDDGADDSAAGE